MGKAVVTEDFEWELQIGKADAVELQGMDGKSTKVKVDGKSVLTASAKFMVSGYTGGAIDVTSSGSTADVVSFEVTAQKTKAEGELVLLDGDKVDVVLNGQQTNPIPPPATKPAVQTDVLIIRSRQSKVLGS